MDGGETFARLLESRLVWLHEDSAQKMQNELQKNKNSFILCTLKQTAKAGVRCSSSPPGTGTQMAYIAVTDLH